MKYYQEISLLPNADISIYFIWQKLYQQTHLALADNKVGNNTSKIGVSFPEYNAQEFLLGTKLRLFAEDEKSLTDMQCEKWIERLLDYAHIGVVTPIPETIYGYACFQQVKLKGSKEKLARRRAKRHGESFEEAMTFYEKYEEEKSKLPYINMVSQSTGQSFRLFIEKQIQEETHKSEFSCYGLSKTSTVPLF